VVYPKERKNYLKRKRAEGKQMDVVLKNLHQSVNVSPHKKTVLQKKK